MNITDKKNALLHLGLSSAISAIELNQLDLVKVPKNSDDKLGMCTVHVECDDWTLIGHIC